MADIKTHLNNIKGALYGKDVRGSIHDGMDAINKEVENTTGRQVDLENTFDQLVINAGNSNAEIVDARVKNDGTSYSKLGDRLDAVDSQLAHIESTVLFIEYFEKLNTDKSDSERINRAINSLKGKGGTIKFANKTYELHDTINIYNGVYLEGVSNYKDGTVFKRVNNVVAFRSVGRSVNSESHVGTHLERYGISKCFIDGGNFSSNLIEFICGAYTTIEDLTIYGVDGCALYLLEHYDSTFKRIFIDYAGTDTRGVIEIIGNVDSGNGYNYEYSNNLYFNEITLETYKGNGVKTIGYNNNNIFFENCKLETNTDNNSALNIYGVNNFRYSGLIAKGVENDILDNMCYFEACTNVILDVNLYLSRQSTTLKSFIKIKNMNGDLKGNILCDNSIGGVYSSPYAIAIESSDSKKVDVDVSSNMNIYSVDGFTKPCKKLYIKDTWQPGVYIDSKGTEWKFFIEGEGSSSSCILSKGDKQLIYIQPDGAIQFKQQLILQNSLSLSKNKPQYPANGSIYFDDTNKKFMGFNGTTWIVLGE